MLTTEEKIKRLERLKIRNLFINLLFLRNYTKGLCILYVDIYHESLQIPELKSNSILSTDDLYWWPTYEEVGRYRSWWYRHDAINKTIRELKKELCKK